MPDNLAYIRQYANFEQLVCRLFNVLEDTNSYRLFSEKVSIKTGIDVFSDDQKTAICCLKKNIEYEKSGNAFREMLKDIQDRVDKILTQPLTFKFLFMVSTYQHDDLLDKYIQMLVEQKQLKFKMNYWSWDTLTQYLEKHSDALNDFKNKTLPRKLYLIPSYNISNALKIDSTLEKLHKILSKQQLVNLFHPLEGLGKTTLAMIYVHTPYYKQTYDHIVWLSSCGDVLMAFNAVFHELIKQQKRDFEKDILAFLKEFDGNNLLVIDNIKHNNELAPFYRDFKRSKWTVLSLSATKLPGYHTFVFPELSQKQHVAIADHRSAKQDTDQLDALVELANGNSYLTFFLSKLLYANIFSDIEDIHNIHEKQKKRIPHLKPYLNMENNVELQKQERQYLSFLLAVLESIMSNLSRNSKRYLRYFAVMPPLAFHFEQLCELFDVTDKNRENFSARLLDLIALGLLSLNGQYFQIHPMLQKVVHKSLKPQASSCKAIILFLDQQLQGKHATQSIPKPLAAQIADTLLKQVRKETISLAALSNNLAVCYENWQQYEQALYFYQKTLSIEKKLLDPDDQSLAHTYHNIANIHSINKDSDAAIKTLMQAVRIFEEHENPDCLLQTFSYKSLALIFQEQKDYDSAIEYIDMALECIKRTDNQYENVNSEILNIQEDITRDYQEYEEQNKQRLWFKRLFR